MDDKSTDTQTTKTQQTSYRNDAYNRPIKPRVKKDYRIIVTRLIWFVVGVINVLLALRIIFFLLKANQSAPFVDFLYRTSEIFAKPFNGIFPVPSYGVSAFDTSSLVAIIIYSLIAWGLVKLVNITKA